MIHVDKEKLSFEGTGAVLATEAGYILFRVAELSKNKKLALGIVDAIYRSVKEVIDEKMEDSE